MADDTSPNPYIRTYAQDVASLSNEPGADDRASVLARLRERASTPQVSEGNLLPHTLPTPVPEVEPVSSPIAQAPLSNLPPPPPSVNALAPEPSFVPSPPVTPVAAPIEKPSPLHTYSSDFADHIDTNAASAFSVLAAQSDAGVRTTAPVRTMTASRKRLYVTIAGVLLMLIGAGGAFGAYRYVSLHSTVPLTPSVSSLVFADERQALAGEGPDLITAFVAAAAAPLGEGKVRVVYLTIATTTPDHQTVQLPLSGGELIGALQLSAPDILLRNIAPESTVGIVHAGPESRAFFILKVLSYERTFAGMLQWEDRIANDLTAFYPAYPGPPALQPTIATTTQIIKGKRVIATTTVPALPVTVVPPRFVDEVASNHDVRALKDSQGNTILLYGYKDKETLVIARNEAAFSELLNRLTATKQQ